MTDFTLHSRLAADCISIGTLPLCEILLLNDARYAWFILVPRRAGIREVYEMSEADQQQMTRESSAFGMAIMDAFNGDKLNIGALGNMVPQLHIHHIVRHEGDAAWPGAVWGVGTGVNYAAHKIDEMKAVIAGFKLAGYKAP